MSDLRAQRDSIRTQMEDTVRRMQTLEENIEEGRDVEQARNELSERRADLSSLRAQLRELMDRAQAGQSMTSTTTTRTRGSDFGAGDAGRSISHASQNITVHPTQTVTVEKGFNAPILSSYVSPSSTLTNAIRTISPNRSGAISRDVIVSTQNSTTNGITALVIPPLPSLPGVPDQILTPAESSTRAENAIRRLHKKQQSEKDGLRELYQRFVGQMEARHVQEMEGLNQRLQMEADRLNQYEEARTKLEQARNGLAVLSNEAAISQHTIAPEIEAIQRQYMN